MTYEDDDGITVGAAEAFNPQHEVAADKNLAIARSEIKPSMKLYEFVNVDFIVGCRLFFNGKLTTTTRSLDLVQ